MGTTPCYSSLSRPCRRPNCLSRGISVRVETVRPTVEELWSSDEDEKCLAAPKMSGLMDDFEEYLINRGFAATPKTTPKQYYHWQSTDYVYRPKRKSKQE